MAPLWLDSMLPSWIYDHMEGFSFSFHSRFSFFSFLPGQVSWEQAHASLRYRNRKDTPRFLPRSFNMHPPLASPGWQWLRMRLCRGQRLNQAIAHPSRPGQGRVVRPWFARRRSRAAWPCIARTRASIKCRVMTIMSQLSLSIIIDYDRQPKTVERRHCLDG